MIDRRSDDPVTLAATAASLVERIFGAVDAVRQQVLELLMVVATGRETLQSRHITTLRPGLVALLAEYREAVVGMGVIVAPGLLPNESRRLEWWQYPPGRDQPAALQVDLNPESLGFYDYDTADWFSVPRSTGRRHIVGPYVDAHGTDRYLLTFTAPVIADGTFLGVVGADVPVSRFERTLLGAWGRHDSEVVIINGQGRVVVSNCTRALSGDLVIGRPNPASTVCVDLPDSPWQLRLSSRASSVIGAIHQLDPT